MRLERLTDKNHPMYHNALALYSISFPDYEQRERTSQDKILKDDEYHFDLIDDGEAFIGLALYWETECFIYVEHFCILPEMRNKGYGKNVLGLLGKKGKKVILEIDPPVDDISIRRKGFYERCGFAENPYPHVHPPYHQGNAGHDLVIMSFPEEIELSEYVHFKDYLECRVMKDAF